MALLVTRSTRVTDTTGPSAPTISVATATTSTITVTRTINSADPSGVAYYETQRSAAGSGLWTTFDSSSTNPLTASGLNPGTAYDFRQRAVDALGNAGTYSDVATASTQAAAGWQDVTTGMTGLGAQLATAGRKVRLDLTGSDYGLRLDTVNGASSSRDLVGAFDGSAYIELRPQTGTVNNPNNTYVGVANGANLWNNGATDVAQANIGYCLYYGSRYIDLAATAKISGVLGAQTLGGETSASAARLGVYEILHNGRRIPYITVRSTGYYPGVFPETESDTLKLGLIGTSINHANNPPLIGQEWMYVEQEVDYRQNRGNPFGRNRLDIWLRDGTHRSIETALNYEPNWDFSWRYAATLEYIGGLFNNPSTANANNFLRVSHVIFSNNRAPNDRIGPPPGFLL